MKVYIVRHGESEGNLSRIHMFNTDPLSRTGIKQAKRVARRFKKTPIDIIISSTHTRAINTAKLIAETIHLPVKVSGLFTEAKRPREIKGKLINIPETQEIRKLIRDNYHNPTFRYSDEETFEDLKNRAQKALWYLQNQKKENIVIISHGDFIRMLVLLVINHTATSYDYFNMRNIAINNTGVTLLEFADNKWKLLTLNDYSHINKKLLG